MSGSTDATPLLGDVGPSHVGVGVRAVAFACSALAAASFVVCFGAPARGIEATRRMGQASPNYDTRCPPVPPRSWSVTPDEGSAHVLVLGDSTDKLWTFEMCSDMLPADQRCSYTDTRPPSWGMPRNIQPFVCAPDDRRCADATCYPEDEDDDGRGCWKHEEFRADSACKPSDPRASTLGFTHIPETDPTFDLSKHWYGEHYGAPALSPVVGERVAQAVAHFADFTQTRPIVVSLDVMFWWGKLRFMGFGGSEIRDPDRVVERWDAILDEYRRGVLGLVDVVRNALRAKNRAGVIVAKVNHNPSYAEGSLELKLHLAMREVLLDVFDRDPAHEDKGLYAFDWYALSERLSRKGKWRLIDGMHQDAVSSRYETEAYARWAATTLPKAFQPTLRG